MSTWLLALCMLPVAWAQTWQAEWRGDRPVTQLSPAASVICSTGARVEARDGLIVFHVPSPAEGAFLGIGTNPPSGEDDYHWGDPSAWDGRKPTTVEARLRVLNLPAGSAVTTQLAVANGRTNWLLGIRPDGLNGLPLDATEFHTYRITLQDGVANLYVDGQRAPDSCLQTFSYRRNALTVGDISSSAGGDSEWEYVRWTNAEATPWEVSPERMAQMERLRVVVGDQEGDVEEVDIAPPFGPPTRLPDGRILAAYPVGKRVVHDDQSERVVEDPTVVEKLFGRFSADDGRTWGAPQTLLEFPAGEGAHIDGAVLTTRNGSVHVFGLHFIFCPLAPPYDYNLARSGLWAARSPDGGKTWDPVRAVDFGHPYTGASNCALQLASGRILVPISRYSDRPTGRFVTCVPYSDDDGLTWQRPVDEVIVNTGGAGLESGACEPVAVELGDGRVWMLIRAQDGYQWETYSSDGGLHWEPARHSRFVSTNSPGALLRLRDGRILWIWSNCGSDNNYARMVLCAALSTDDGRTWHGYREIARDPEGEALSYPYLTETGDGKVLVVIMQGGRMIRLDPAFLMRRELTEDFSRGLGKWSQMGTEGARVVTDPDGGTGRMLALCKARSEVPGGVCWNFPFGVRGTLSLSLRLEPGSEGFHLALSDHYDPPGLAKQGGVSLRVTGEGKLQAVGSGVSWVDMGTTLTPGAWHELSIRWDCPAGQATLTVDGIPVGVVPVLGPEPGVCYLRLRPLAETTDHAGLMVRKVHVAGDPGE